MDNVEKSELERHIRRISQTIDSWSLAERRARSEDLKVRLSNGGTSIDVEMNNAIDQFCNGTIAFQEFSHILQGKI